MKTNNAKMIIQQAGGAANVARLIAEKYGDRITVQAIHQWETIPGDRAIQLHVLTQLPLEDIRPDLF